ncbi:MAG: DUF4239 domain-containing protein [Candidatus Omnitrophica bacterium]|nr:DUF4239 domain-containing protein [Candidatus Omnitrophota bacterium]
MSITHLLLLKVPVFILGPAIVGGAALFSVLGLLIVRRFVHHSRLKVHHDIADPMLGAISAVYAVLIAFIVVAVWQSFDKTNANVQQEANYLADIYRDAEAFAPDFKEKVGILLREYREVVANLEWKAMQEGQMSPEAEKIMRQIWALYISYHPKNATEQSFFDESIRKLNSFREMRRQRLMDSRAEITPLLWLVLLSGAVVTISFTFLFGSENLHAQIVMGVLLSALISLILFTIIELDFPFTGSVVVSPEPISQVLLD